MALATTTRKQGAAAAAWTRLVSLLPRHVGVSARSCRVRHQCADTKRTHQKRHARRLATHLEIGKEGVDGSSPSEGFLKVAAKSLLPLASQTTRRSADVHETSTAPKFGDLVSA
jgi:hypothetical protein